MDELQENERLVSQLLQQLKVRGGLRHRLALCPSLVEALRASNGMLRTSLGRLQDPQPLDAEMKGFALLSLPDDIIRDEIATRLDPRDRLHLGLSCQRLLRLVWPQGTPDQRWAALSKQYDIECSIVADSKFVFQVAVSPLGHFVAFVDEVDDHARGPLGRSASPSGFLGRLNLWDVRRRTVTSQSICRKLIPRNWRCSIHCLEFSPCGKLLGVAGEHLLMPRFRHAMGLFRLTNEKGNERGLTLIKRMYLDATGISSFAFSSDGEHLACVSRRGEIDIWRLLNSGEAVMLERAMIEREAQDQFNVEVLNVTYSPDGSILVSSSFNSAQQVVSFSVWNPGTGQRLRVLRLPNDGGSLFARSMPSISCDGSRVALTRDGFFPNTISHEVWNLFTKEREYSSTSTRIPSRGVIPYRKLQTMTCRFSEADPRSLLLFSVRDQSDSWARCVALDMVDLDQGEVSSTFPLSTAQLRKPPMASPCLAFIPPGSEMAEGNEWIHAWVCDSTSVNGAWAVVVTESDGSGPSSPTLRRQGRRMRPFVISMRNIRAEP